MPGFLSAAAVLAITALFADLRVRGLLLHYGGYEEDCTTPDGDPGLCRSLKTCRRMLELLVENKSNAESPLIEYIRRSHCGFDGFNPIVCCPLERTKPRKNGGQGPLAPISGQYDDSCGIIQDENKVVGGTTTGLREFPWMALIGYKTRHGVQYRCGGTLVSSRYVLTAAHCVSSLTEISPTTVRLGEHDLRTERDCSKNGDCSAPPVDVPIDKVIPHPAYYKPELRNDIALIKLANAVETSDSVRPICLPLNARSSPTTRAVVTGWGTTDTGIKSDVLLKASLPIVSPSKCRRVYSRKFPITRSQICAGGETGRDSCSGDSGGPLQVMGLNSAGQPAYIQHGVVSFGPRKCGTEGMPGVYTRVAYYSDWLLKNMKD